MSVRLIVNDILQAPVWSETTRVYPISSPLGRKVDVEKCRVPDDHEHAQANKFKSVVELKIMVA